MTAYRIDRDVVLAEGPDTLSFLQGQLSQDVAGLALGDAAFSFLLHPTGKVVALVRVTRVADEAVALDVDAGWGPAVIERLNRFKLRTRVELAPVPWGVVALVDEVAPDGPWAVVAERGPGVDLVGPVDALPAVDGDAGAYEVIRIEAGVPRMGRELDESTIPAEAGAGVLARSVSFTKGCYTGQELVARIDSRGGNVPRQIRPVTVTGGSQPPVGARLERDGTEVGELTSVAVRADGTTVALASVARSAAVPGPVSVWWDGGRADAEVGVLATG